MSEKYKLRLEFEFLYKPRALLVKCIHCGASLRVFLSYIFTFCGGFIPPCKMEFIPRINQIRGSRAKMWGGNLFILWRTILISPPPPRPVFTQVFLPEKLKSGRYYQALGYPWPNIGLNMARWNQPATDLCLSKAVRGRVIQ